MHACTSVGLKRQKERGNILSGTPGGGPAHAYGQGQAAGLAGSIKEPLAPGGAF